MSEDYREASVILDDSPRMSAVLSRRVLADLLDKYAELKDKNLVDRIDKFIADKTHPSRIRENLHYLREMGNFGAHTQENKSPQVASPQQGPSEATVINVSKEEAEWTIKVVEDLFDYFIVAPEKDKFLRMAFDQKIKDAKRKPINPPTP
jgi:hypothetical protein